ncbi:hypothetical protein Pla110_44450 [Polystyrenella longa]|uniref:Uncharacterized protein n=1 Tax=Polystyrenella longa TaxID=2528007 RepID=A0A518CU20_9PLAN|nr:hypothetical protein [Polystyrenella longa]QDU82684.1 hypothetical protein Pla110_44450 [Polystyrenella longa]
MSVSINPIISMTAQETLDTGVAAASNPAITHSGFNLNSSSLNANTTPPVTTASYQKYTLDGSGDATIDLTALLGVANESQDATGLKVQTVIVKNPAGNATLTISPGASNPYPLNGTGNDIEVPAGSTFGLYFADTLADVAASVKEIDIAGGAAETFQLGICLG